MAFITGVGKGAYDAEEEAKRGAWKKSGLGPFDAQNKMIASAKEAARKKASKKQAEVDYSNSLSPSERSKKLDEILGKVPQDSYMDDDGLKPTKSVSKAMPAPVESTSVSKSSVSTPKKEAPVIKKTTVTAVKSAPAKSSSKMADMASEWAKFSKSREADTAALKDITDRYNKTGTLVDSEDVNTPGKLEATENSEGYKKGGMTKRRPPKPAKKAPAKRFASGGSTGRSSASKRGDGCATKGHTKGKYC